MKKIIAYSLISYFLILFQASFLAPFRIFYYFPSLAIVFILFLNLFEPQENQTGLISALTTGFLLDIYSDRFFGFYIIILVAASWLIKTIVKKYFHLKIGK